MSIKEWRQNHEEERRQTQVELQDSLMTCSREDASLEKVKHSNKFHNRKRHLVNNSKDDNFDKTFDHTADSNSYSNHSPRKAKKIATPNGHSISLNHRHNLRTRTNSSCKMSTDESSNHSSKSHNNRPLASQATSPHRNSSRISSKVVESPSKQVNSHSSRSNRHSSRLQNVDLNSSANSNHSFSTRRSSRNVSFRWL